MVILPGFLMVQKYDCIDAVRDAASELVPLKFLQAAISIFSALF
jgi:hypothetical protein